MRISDWSSDVCSSDLLGVGRLIRPYQKPHPPIAVSLRAANSYTARQAGSRGWIPVSGNFIPAADVATHWPTYAAGAEEAGRRPDPSLWRVGRTVLVTGRDAEAEDILADPHGGFTRSSTYLNLPRSEARRGGKEGVHTCKS